jgi:hypothetical protein
MHVGGDLGFNMANRVLFTCKLYLRENFVKISSLSFLGFQLISSRRIQTKE